MISLRARRDLDKNSFESKDRNFCIAIGTVGCPQGSIFSIPDLFVFETSLEISFVSPSPERVEFYIIVVVISNSLFEILLASWQFFVLNYVQLKSRRKR